MRKFRADAFDSNHCLGNGAESDSDCMEPIVGDANLDGEVDFQDFLKLSANFGSIDQVWGDGDFNSDTEVNFSDFLVLSENYGASIA